MEEELRKMLAADAALTALAGTNISWDVLDQGKAKPGVRLTLISGVPDYTTAGPSGLVDSRVQIDSFASTRPAALAVGRAIEAVLSGFAGVKGTVSFRSIFKVSDRSGFEKSGSEEFYRHSADYQIWSGEAAAS